MYKFSSRSLKVLSTVHPTLQAVMTRALALSPIDFGIPPSGGLRTAEKQRELFVAGKSKCDGYKVRSRHQSGEAVDVYAYVNGQASWDKHHLAIIAGVVLSVAKSMGVELRWGGTFGSSDWKGWDYPHFELKK